MKFIGAYLATFKDVLTDRSGLLILFMAVVLYSLFYPSAYNHQVAHHTPIAVADLDQSALSRRLVMAARATEGVDVVAEVGSKEQGQQLLEQGHVDAVLWIGANFERDTLRGRKGNAALLGNGAYLVRSRGALGALAGALNNTAVDAIRMMVPAQGVPAAPPVTAVMRPLFNTQDGYGSAIVPGVFVMVVHQTLLLGICLMMPTWRTRYGRKMTTTWFAARAFAFITIGCLGLLYFWGMAFWQQDYPRGGEVFRMLFLAPIFAAAVVMPSMWLGSFLLRREQGGQLLLPMSFMFFFYSGLTWPHSNVAPALVELAKLVPATLGIHLTVKLVEMHATLTEAAPEWTRLALTALVFGIAAWIRLCAPLRPKRSERRFIGLI